MSQGASTVIDHDSLSIYLPPVSREDGSLEGDPNGKIFSLENHR